MLYIYTVGKLQNIRQRFLHAACQSLGDKDFIFTDTVDKHASYVIH